MKTAYTRVVDVRRVSNSVESYRGAGCNGGSRCGAGHCSVVACQVRTCDIRKLFDEKRDGKSATDFVVEWLSELTGFKSCQLFDMRT